MAAKKPAIQMTNGIDDIIKGGIKGATKLIERYGARRTLGDGVVTSASKAVKGRKNVMQNAYGQTYGSLKRAKKASKNFRGTQFPKNQSLTKKQFKKVYPK
ncbi:unannotated protein [freshwater metagenome]|uniref:Unannotated protein n=1 Tax=freshwater metagenome TaxID=449393 RepID=A0A6J7BUX6_9ZZZZ